MKTPYSESQEKQPSISFIEHLTELRTRLIYGMSSVLLVFVCMIWFAQDIYTFIATPVLAVLPHGIDMIATEMTSTLFAPLKLTFFLAVIVCIPIILHQSWSFISPGLYRHERKIAIPLLISSVLLFYAGIAFALWIVLPVLVQFFAASAPQGVEFMPDIQHYLNIVMKLFFAFGLAFEIPVALMLLIWSKVVTAQHIKNQRAYIIIGCFIVAMLLTPPDIFSQTLLALPMWGLFELGLVMAHILKLEQR